MLELSVSDLPEVRGHCPVDVLEIVLPCDVGRVDDPAAPGHHRLRGLRRQVDHHLTRVLDALPLLEHFEHRVAVIHLLHDELRLDGARPERDHGHPSLPELVGAVRRHPVAAGLAHAIGDIEQVPEVIIRRLSRNLIRTGVLQWTRH